MKIIESLQNPLIKHMVKLKNDRSYRYSKKRAFVEGKKIVQELKHVVNLFVERDKELPKDVDYDEIFIVSREVMEKLSGVKTPEGVVAEARMPEKASLQNKRYLLAFDGVSDPGNLGALLRTGLALGWEGVLILENSCDPFNEKAIRASKGAAFRMPICQGGWNELKEISLPVWVADIKGKSVDDIKEKEGLILVLGSESQGVSKEALKLGKAITIPMMGEMESLNVAVAGGILMYGLRRK